MAICSNFDFTSNYRTQLYLSNKSDVKALLSCFITEADTGESPHAKVIIMDKKVFDLHQDIISSQFNKQILLLRAGEKTKSQATVNRIYAFFTKCRVNRFTEIIVIGGGTITDVSSFAVSTFKRGCKLTLIPSTLLCMVDAALGGKTALNFHKVKNHIGTFFPAHKIILVPELLLTLPEPELRNGLAEMLKLNFIIPDLPDPVSIIKNRVNPELISAYAKAKLDICIQDLDDRDIRRLLNLGHTFAHAVESSDDLNLPHGEAVAIGIATAARLSQKLEYINRKTCSGIINRLQQAGFNTELICYKNNNFKNTFMKFLAQDKKAKGQMLNLILFNKGLKVQVVKDIPYSKISEQIFECVCPSDSCNQTDTD